MSEPTNETRYLAAEAALNAHASAKGDIADEHSVIYLLSDLMHYCEREGFDFDQSLSMATDHYSEESGI